MEKPLLIVDDNEGVFESLEMNFLREGQACLWAATSAEALRLAGENDLRAAVIDLSLGSESGLDAMRAILDVRPGLPVVFISGFGTVEAAVSAVKMGAYDFLPKPLNFKKLKTIIGEAVQAAAAGRPAPERGGLSMPLTAAPDGSIAQLLRQAERVADSDLPVLITGESGVGKDLLAEYLHVRSSRGGNPLIRVNCSAISDSLAESELFGHVKGAFTGAVGDHKGFFEQADGGTLHLDEVGDMTPATQARVLRVIEDRRVRRVGATSETGVSVRVVATTNKNLENMAAEGAFREDLFYRLDAVGLHVPPLRERPEDVRPLIERFLLEADPGGMKRFSQAALDALLAYSWPGNVRELKNVVKASILLNPGEVVDFDDLPRTVRTRTRPSERRYAGLEEAEREAVLKAMREAGGNKKLAAKNLGVSLRTLYYKLDRYGL